MTEFPPSQQMFMFLFPTGQSDVNHKKSFSYFINVTFSKLLSKDFKLLLFLIRKWELNFILNDFKLLSFSMRGDGRWFYKFIWLCDFKLLHFPWGEMRGGICEAHDFELPSLSWRGVRGVYRLSTYFQTHDSIIPRMTNLKCYEWLECDDVNVK